MATAKKSAPKAAASVTVRTPGKVVKHVARSAVKPATMPAAKKAPVSKTAQAIAKLSTSIAKLTERKDKINAEISALRDQRTALKAVPVAVAVRAAVAPKAKGAVKAAPKNSVPVKAVKRAVKK